MKTLSTIVFCSIFLSGCGTVNNALTSKTKAVEYYHIFDIKTDADRFTVAEAASNGLGRNVNSAQESTPIPSFSTPPEKPGRFKLSNPFKGSSLGMLAASGGANLNIATCDGAVWIANAKRDVTGSSNLKITVCLWQYAGGYHLDTYGAFQKKEGGLMQISRSIASSMVGTPEEWTEKTFLDIVRSIQKITNAKITHLEGFPKLNGTPWLDKYDKM